MKFFSELKIGESFSYELFPNQFVACYKKTSRTGEAYIKGKGEPDEKAFWLNMYFKQREEVKTGAVVFVPAIAASGS